MNKKKFIVTVSVLTILIVVCSCIFPGFFAGKKCKKYFSRDIPDAGSIRLISHAVEVNGNSNTVSGLKEAVRLGADGVVVDICFLNDDVPVLCDDYRKRDTCEKVEDLFRELSVEKFKDITIYLHIVQLSSLSELNVLVAEYDMTSRVFLTGIDRDRYGLIRPDDTGIPFYLDYSPGKEDLDENGEFSGKPSCIDEYGACGLIIGRNDFNEELAASMNDAGVQVIVSGVGDRLQMCEKIAEGALNIYTDDIGPCREALNEWTAAADLRYRESLEKSINALVNSAEK